MYHCRWNIKKLRIIVIIIIINFRQIVKDFFEENVTALFSVNSDIIKHKLCVFIDAYIEDLTTVTDKNFQAAIDFLFEHLFYFRQNEGVAYEVKRVLKIGS